MIKDIHHQYYSDDFTKRAEVWFNGQTWGCDFFLDDVKVGERPFENHSESYAESAAENYVQGILIL